LGRKAALQRQKETERVSQSETEREKEREREKEGERETYLLPKQRLPVHLPKPCVVFHLLYASHSCCPSPESVLRPFRQQSFDDIDGIVRDSVIIRELEVVGLTGSHTHTHTHTHTLCQRQGQGQGQAARHRQRERDLDLGPQDMHVVVLERCPCEQHLVEERAHTRRRHTGARQRISETKQGAKPRVVSTCERVHSPPPSRMLAIASGGI
jgi:hypothetical protein